MFPCCIILGGSFTWQACTLSKDHHCDWSKGLHTLLLYLHYHTIPYYMSFSIGGSCAVRLVSICCSASGHLQCYTRAHPPNHLIVREPCPQHREQRLLRAICTLVVADDELVPALRRAWGWVVWLSVGVQRVLLRVSSFDLHPARKPAPLRVHAPPHEELPSERDELLDVCMHRVFTVGGGK